MKNKLNILIVLPLIVFVALGCGLVERIQKTVTGDSSNSQPIVSDSNKSTADKAIEQVADGETTGVQECDDAIRFVNDQMKSPDDNWMTKGMKDYVAGQIKRSIKESIAENQGDAKKMAQQCTDLKNSFEKSLKEEKEKQTQ